MPTLNPVTQRDVARICVVHPSTICLALKNSPSIPPDTRRRIQAVASELGYQPNAAARNLAFLRTDKKGTGSLPIAWINQEHARDHWRADPEAAAYFEAASRRAAQLGYHLEEIWARELGMTVSRLVQIVHARGIDGVIFPAHGAFDFTVLSPAWADFATVGFNDHRLGEWIDVVCPDYYQNTDVTLQHLRRMEYGRIGLVLTPQFDAATNGLPHSCFLRYQSGLTQAQSVPVCFAQGALEAKKAALTDWLRTQRPDAVICHDAGLFAWARQAFPPIFWVRGHAVMEESTVGLDECVAEIAAAAIDCVTEKMRVFEKGLGGSTRLHLIKGSWLDRRAMECAETVVA